MENKKVVYGIVGGVTLLASAGLIYYMMSKTDKVAIEEETGSKEDKKCVDAIKALGPVKNDANGKLDFEYLLKFCETVGRHAKAKQEIQKRELVTKRRIALKDNDETTYKDCIQQIIDQE